MKLTWADFKGNPPANPGGMSANTSSSVDLNPKLVDDSVFVEVTALFNYNSSWVIVTDKTDLLLEHEQRHFDLTEIQARKLREYVKKWNGKTGLNEYFKKGNDSIFKVGNKMQDQYDLETEHSKNQIGQKKWNKKIDSLLNAYRAYENPTVKLFYGKK